MSVVVVGSVNRDIVSRVERIPGPGETVLASGLTRTGGGKGANQAVAAARAGGAAVAFAGAVGDDAEGAALRDALVAAGIDVAALETVEGPTGIALISVADDGENAIVVVAGANHEIERLTDPQRRAVAAARVLVTQLEVRASLVVDAAAARAAGAWHVHNAAPSGPFAAHADALFAGIDVLIVNEHEAREIAASADLDGADLDGADLDGADLDGADLDGADLDGADLHSADLHSADFHSADFHSADLHGAVDALAARVPALVVTAGAAGCIVAVGTERARVDAFPVDAADTTGAGDTFCGVFAASLVSVPRAGFAINDLVRAVRTGAAAAAIAVTRAGAQDAVPTVAELRSLLEGAS